MGCSNIVYFLIDQHVAARTVAVKRRRTDHKSLRDLSEPLLVRAEATLARFQKLFLLRLEILVNEREMNVDKYSD